MPPKASTGRKRAASAVGTSPAVLKAPKLDKSETPPKTRIATRKTAVVSVAAADSSAISTKLAKDSKPVNVSGQRIPTPMQTQLTFKPVPPPSKQTFTSELQLGGVSYTCMCTCDPEVASSWAELVTKDAREFECHFGPVVGILGMDCEWAAPWHRGPGVPDRLATLQLVHHGSAGRRSLVFSVASLAGKLPAAVVALMGDARLAKVGVNIAGDASRLVRDFGCTVRGLYDLCNLSKKPGAKLRKSISLEDVVRAHCPQEMHISKGATVMSKGVRTSNWEAWPLSNEQVEYAAKDAALGVMAFVHRYGMAGSDVNLTKAAAEALVDLEEANCESNVSGSLVTFVQSGAPAASTATSSSSEPDKNKPNFFIAMRNNSVKAPNIGKKEHPVGANNALSGVCIVVSGILDSFERAEMEQYVKDHGGTVSKSVTAKVTHLVTDHGEAGPSKVAKCKELGIPCVSEDVILQMVRES